MTDEHTNEDRAARAEAALVAYAAAHDDGAEETDLSDLLADLMHYADAKGGLNFDEAMKSALMNYEAEAEAFAKAKGE